MKSGLYLSFFLLALFILADKSFSLTEKKIKIVCKNERRESICIKNLQEKKSNLQKGNKIEIPVIPYKK